MGLFKKKEEAVIATAYECKFPLCEECDKYVALVEGEMRSTCTVPVIVTKQAYQMMDNVLLHNTNDIIELKKTVATLEHEICDLRKPKRKANNESTKTKKTATAKKKGATDGNGDTESK